VADLAKNGQTTDPLLAAILTAQTINRFVGTQLKPWELDQVPEEFIHATLSLTDQLPKYLEHEQKVKASDEAFKNERRKKR
jgi:hypothetical protein